MMEILGVTLSNQSTSGGQGNEKIIGIAEVVGNVREQVRQWARDKEMDPKELQSKLLQICDAIRDDMLPPLGIRLEDREGGGAPSIKVVDPDELKAEIQAKKNQEEAKRLEKERKKQEAAAKQANKAAEVLKNPAEYFKTDEYTKWDENGIPTHDKEGKEVTKSQVKKLTKLMEAYKKKFEKKSPGPAVMKR